MRVLVTGGTGYLGQAIVRALRARGHTPVVLARRPPTQTQTPTSGVFSALSAGSPDEEKTSGAFSLALKAEKAPDVFIRGDVRDRDALVAAARGCDACVHTAALVAVWRPRAADFDDVNVGGLRHALEAVRTHGLQRMVYTSSFLALPPAGRGTTLNSNDYQRTKAIAERVAAEAHASGAPIVRMYPGVIYGPGLMSDGNLVGKQIADHLAGRLPGLLGADRIWSFAWVESVAAAHVAALEHPAPAPTYQVGGPNEPQQRPFEILRDLKGTRLPQRLPWWTGHAAALVDPARTALLGAPRQITHKTVAIFRNDWPLDSSAAQRDLGYVYPTLTEGITRILEVSNG